MAFSCYFQRITGTDCSFDRLDKSKSLEIVTQAIAQCPIQLAGLAFSARTRRRDWTQSAHTTGVNSDLAGGETLPSAACHKSNPNMEQIEKQIEEFRKWYRSTSLRRRESLT